MVPWILLRGVKSGQGYSCCFQVPSWHVVGKIFTVERRIVSIHINFYENVNVNEDTTWTSISE
jgi:hypothetical protein